MNNHTDKPDCKTCYREEYPKPCKCRKGWVHNEFLDEDYDNVFTRNFCSNPDCQEDVDELPY